MSTFDFKRISSPTLQPWMNDFFMKERGRSFDIFSFPLGQFGEKEEECPEDPGLRLFGQEEDKDLDFFLLSKPRASSAGERYMQREESDTLTLVLPNPKDLLGKIKQNSKNEKSLTSKKIQKVKSVKISKTKQKSRLKTKKTKAANSSKKSKVTKKTKERLKKANSKRTEVETCSTLSQSNISITSVYPGDELDLDLSKTYKFNETGVGSDIPQIFSSSLFSKVTSSKVEDSSVFMHSSIVASDKNVSTKQIGAVSSSILSQLKCVKTSNLEAGSYMASLETTLEFINKLSSLI